MTATPTLPTRMTSRSARRGPTTVTSGALVLGVLGIVGYTALLSWAARHYTYDQWGGLVIGPLLYAGSLPLLRRIARRERDPFVSRLFAIALALKLLMAPVRYLATSTLYAGVGDAHQYHLLGAQLATLFRRGVFAGWEGAVPGTGFIEILTGAVYSVIGVTELGGYLVFSWLAFWGLYWFYRAFCLGVPDGNHRRYALLVTLLPSLLFWPSSIGKEAWMTLALGVTAYGIAAVYVRGTRAIPVLAAGLLAVTIARPHLTLIVVCAFAVGYIVRPSPGTTMFAPITKLLGIGALVVLVAVSVGQAKQFFRAESASKTDVSLSQALNTALSRTAKGGSKFTTEPVTSPLGFPQAAVTVLFRPFPFEIHNGQGAIASIDGTIMLGLTARALMHLRGRRRGHRMRVRRQPYLMFGFVYVTLFVIAFSSFANFGILARERVQVIPILLVFICLAMPANHAARSRVPVSRKALA